MLDDGMRRLQQGFCSMRSFQAKQRSREPNQSSVWSVLDIVGTGLVLIRTLTARQAAGAESGTCARQVLPSRVPKMLAERQLESTIALNPVQTPIYRTQDDPCHSKVSAVGSRMMTPGVCVGQRLTCVPPSQFLALLAVEADPGRAARVSGDPQIQLCVVWQDDRPAGAGNAQHHTPETPCSRRIIQTNVSLPICQQTCRPQNLCGLFKLMRERQLPPSRGC